MRSVRVLLAVALVLGFCGMATAATIVDQTTYAWSNNRQAAMDGNVMADDFTLASAATITSFNFRGTYDPGWDEGQLNGITVKFYNNNSGAPGLEISSTSLSSGWTIDGDLYSIPVSQNLSAGTYWVGVTATHTNWSGELKISWANDEGVDDDSNESTPKVASYVPNGASAMRNGTTSYGRYWFSDWEGGRWQVESPVGTNIPLDLSFSLTADVPEPSSIVLVGMGLVGLLAYAWRKRK